VPRLYILGFDGPEQSTGLPEKNALGRDSRNERP
jgi:hypothetical protein